MRIARVFPTRTSMSPEDKDAYFGEPDLFTPQYDEVHISVTFTWDIPKARRLENAWKTIGRVIIGGVAIDGESDKRFEAGRYLRKGITITTRGCPNNCGFCQVRKGQFIELDDFPEGNIIQDNNILASSDHHWRLVMDMLKKQRAIKFSGGLDKFRLTEKRIEDLRSLRIAELWLACDSKTHIEPLRKTITLLHKAGFNQNKLRCFVLIGQDSLEEDNDRCLEVLKMGCLPFAQLLKNKENNIEYSKEYKRLNRFWSRPAIYKSLTKPAP